MNSHIALCTLELYLPESQSLKDKRAVIKSIKQRLRNKYNVAVAEVDKQDKWQLAELAIVTVSNQATFTEQVIKQAVDYVETNHPQAIVNRCEIELV